MRVRLKRERLLELLAGSRLSQNHWAIKLGLSRGHWSEIVNGKHPYPSAKTRTRMLEVFGASLDDLFVIESGPAPWPDTDFRAAIASRYLIDGELGQGGMGAVYLARDTRHGRPVALKVISPEAVSGIGLTQFLREISTVAHLQHPHILPLFDSGEVVGYPFYVMPWIRAGSLRNRLRRDRKLPLRETLRIAGGVAAALEYAHGQRILHCDVKPENILLDGDHAYVMDFGISRALHRESHEWGRPASLDLSAGTPAYVSPEQANGDPALDARSDVYSLACVVFEMLSGRLPFEGRTTELVVAKRFQGPPPILEANAPPAVGVVLGRAMQMDRDGRPGTPLRFTNDLARAAAAGRPGPARRLIESARLAGRPRLGRLRGALRGGSMARIWDDVRFALRGLWKQPGFAAAVLTIQAVAIAANTSVFSLADAVLFRPLPYLAQSGLVQVWGGDGENRFHVSERERAAYRAEPALFAGVGAWTEETAMLGGDHEPEQLAVGLFDADLLSVLGVSPAIGRGFASDETVPGRDVVVLLGHSFWRTRFGGDSAAVGRSLIVDGRAHSVIGVLPSDFRLPSEFGGTGSSLYLPLALDPVPDPRNFHYLSVVARLRPGSDVADTERVLSRVAARLEAEIPQLPSPFLPRLVPIHQQVVGDSRGVTLLLLGSVGLMLLVAAANVAGLVVARSEGRRRELAVRAALGASRGRLGRQFLTESLVIASIGGLLGLGLATLVVRGLATFALIDLPRADTVRVDLRAIGFTFLVAALAGIMSGIAPAWSATRRNIVDRLRDGGRTTGGAERIGVRRGLLVAEMALAVTLAIAAGLMVRTWQSVLAVDPGFSAEHAGSLQVSLPALEHPDRATRRRFYRSLLDRVRALPGVVATGATRALPLVDGVGDWGFHIEGRPLPGPNERSPYGDWHVVTDGYFEALGVPVLEGRTFAASDDTSGAGVVVINEVLARRHWPDQSPLGARIRMTSNVDTVWRTVIGVVGGVRQQSLEQPPRPEYFLPYMQFPRTTGDPPLNMHLVVRTSRAPEALASAVRLAIRDLSPGVAVTGTQPVGEILSAARAPRRVQFLLLAGFAAAALGLLAVGVYGVVAQLVGLRTREFGIRLALVSSAGRVRWLVLGGQGHLVLAGLVLGGLGGLGLAALMRSLLYGVEPTDPVVFAASAAAVGLVVLAGSLVPAYRAARTEITEVLRAD